MPDYEDAQETSEDQSATQVNESDQQTVTDESAGQTSDDQGASQQTTDDPKAAYENGPRDDGVYAGDTESVEVAAENVQCK